MRKLKGNICKETQRYIELRDKGWLDNKVYCFVCEKEIGEDEKYEIIFWGLTEIEDDGYITTRCHEKCFNKGFDRCGI